jgi:hypothetical protein
MWKYFKNDETKVYAYAADGSQDAYITTGLVPISEVEADALRFPPLTPEQATEQRRAEIRTRLSEIDAESIRPLRAVTEDTAEDFDREKLASLDAEAVTLRAELAALPEPVTLP